VDKPLLNRSNPESGNGIVVFLGAEEIGTLGRLEINERSIRLELVADRSILGSKEKEVDHLHTVGNLLPFLFQYTYSIVSD
jgi:hypothetical protein